MQHCLILQKLSITLMKMNKANVNLNEIDTVILAGGLGTRLQPVLKDKPKCLAPINGKPFIDILLDNFIDQGLQRFIICVGYLKEQIIEHLRERNDCEIVFSVENEPLGTGGALKNAETYIKSDPFLVMNGDSYTNINFTSMLVDHINSKGLITIGVSKVVDNSDFGVVIFNKSLRITGFSEKLICTSKYVNAGVYLFQKELITMMPRKRNFSLEKDVFENIYQSELCYAYNCIDDFVDIGTPDRLDKVNRMRLI